MSILNRSAILGFLCGILTVMMLGTSAFFLVAGSESREKETPATALAAPPLPSVTALHLLDGAFVDMYGREKSFADLNGKVVLINIWGTWCPPCRAEMPSLERLWKIFKDDENVEICCISEEKASVVSSHPLGRNLDLPLYVFASGIPRELRSGDIPATYIFDRDGRMVFFHTGMARWDAPEVISYLRALAAREQASTRRKDSRLESQCSRSATTAESNQQ